MEIRLLSVAEKAAFWGRFAQNLSKIVFKIFQIFKIKKRFFIAGKKIFK